MSLTICGAQMAAVWEEPEKTLEIAAVYVEEASSAGASLIVFPEQFTTGWDPKATTWIQDLSGSITKGVAALARKNHIAVLGSVREAHDPLPRNTSFVVDAKGSILAQYSKIHLFSPEGENQAFSGGNEPALFEIDGLSFGIAICYDLRFAELFSVYASMGALCVLVPSAWPCRRIDHFHLLIRARALEHQNYVAGISGTGDTPIEAYCGQSLIAGPSGETVVLGPENESLITGTLEPERVQDAQRRIPTHSDRRDDLYVSFRKRP
ncbi:MAG: nitrilase-related carbon-nitrogen hydrolase [Methanomicrobiaceae archaeon]|nr:nitrilase-related carbon-nitrogen hydrolase [Methanomicrobiaceae archaeon]